MKKAKSGFTMVELLVTIIILGLLTTLAYFGVSAILDRGNSSYYDSQENMLVLAGREYFADYREKLPDDIGDTTTVTLETLIEEEYIDPVKDEDEKDCDYGSSTVTIQKITEKDYQYYVTLICDAYKTTEDSAKPVIIFNPNRKSSQNPITVQMNITDNKEVSSYRYVIVKDGETYQDTGYQIYTGNLTINLTEKGLYQITGYAIDSSGNRASRKSGKYSIYVGIDCSKVEFSSDIDALTWTNNDITVNMELPDNTYRWELSQRINGGEYISIDNYLGAVGKSITLNSEGKNQLKLVLYDKDGNSCIAASEEYYIDKTNPTCISSGGSEEWTSNDITLTGTCSDSGSGCVGNAKKTYSTETNKTNQSPGVVKDKAGNSTSCPADQTVRVDKTPPTCVSSGGSSNWTSGSVTLIGTCSDSGSGCVGNVTKVISTETNKTNQSPGVVKDNVGHETTCPGNQTVRVDKTAPKISVVLKKKNNSTDLDSNSNINSLSNYTNNSWYSGYVVARATCTDNSGSCTISHKVTGVSNNTNGFVNGDTRNINAEGTSYITFRATDSTGHTTEASYTINLDRTAPVIVTIPHEFLLEDGSFTYVRLRPNFSDSLSGLKSNISFHHCYIDKGDMCEGEDLNSLYASVYHTNYSNTRGWYYAYARTTGMYTWIKVYDQANNYRAARIHCVWDYSKNEKTCTTSQGTGKD